MRTARLAALALAFARVSAPASAQDTHTHTGTHTHEQHVASLHFTHPLIAESVSPDTKLRVDFSRPEPSADVTWELEAEYAFTRAFSVEIGTHYESESHEFGHTHVFAKFANYSLGDRGVLLGFGLGVGIPSSSSEEMVPDSHTHDSHEDAYEIEPFINAGLKRGNWETAGWMRYTHGFATDEAPASDRVSYNLVTLLHATALIQPLLEVHGVAVGNDAAPESASVTPSLRLVPFKGKGLAIGAGVSFPIAGSREYDSRLALSAFWHF